MLTDADRLAFEQRARRIAATTASLMAAPKLDGRPCVTIHDRDALVSMLALMFLGVIMQENGIPLDRLHGEQPREGGG
jgi:hypothetical protein